MDHPCKCNSLVPYILCIVFKFVKLYIKWLLLRYYYKNHEDIIMILLQKSQKMAYVLIYMEEFCLGFLSLTQQKKNTNCSISKEMQM